VAKKIVIVKKQSTEQPEKKRGCLGSAVALAVLIVSGIYILNPTAGIDLLPDNSPLIGNLDEAFFVVVFLSALAYFGLEIPLLSRRYGVSAKQNEKPPTKIVEGEDDAPKK